MPTIWKYKMYQSTEKLTQKYYSMLDDYNFFSKLDSQPWNFFKEFEDYVDKHPESSQGIEDLIIKYQEHGTLNFVQLVLLRFFVSLK